MYNIFGERRAFCIAKIFSTFLYCETSFVVVIIVMCMTISKLLLPYGRKQVLVQVQVIECVQTIKKYVKISWLEFLNEDHILRLFLLCKNLFSTNCMLCVLIFIHEWWNLQFKVVSQR